MKFRKGILALCALLSALLILLSGCAPAVEAASSSKLTKADKKAFASAINTFNWDLYDTAATEENLFYSAYSIESALAMTDVAASGKTKTQMEKVLGISDLSSFERAMKWYRKLYDDPDDEATGKLTTANSIWLEKSLSLAKNYKTDVQEPLTTYFGAEVKRVSFKNQPELAKKQISQWVKKNTNGMITDYEPLCDSNTVADLINAIYFYGEWASKFESVNTAERKFYGSKGTTKVDSMVQGELNLRYVKYNGIRGIALPYKSGTFEMDIFMAKKSTDISSTWKSADKEKLFTKLDAADTTFVRTLQLPKFTLDVTFPGLTKSLQKMGMKIPFTASADFSKLADSLYISDVGHRAKLEVDEEGSRAAAVTEVVMNETAMLEPETAIEFIVDRPFILVIRDKTNNVILFTGQVNNL